MWRGVRRGGLVALLLVIALAACEEASDRGAPAPRHHASPASGRTGDATATGSTALQALDGLAVKGRAPMTGYDRAAFGPAWSDDNAEQFGHNGCDTRNDILRRDLTDVVLEPGTHDCVVERGVLADPYGGSTIGFVRGVGTSLAVQIDHVVALGDAWQTGAQQWSSARRQDFANDPLELLAADGGLNESKGDGDAATWLPPDKAFRCTYVARQVAVKATWHLWVTPAEKAAMARVLSRCPDQGLP